jgi:CheY-like chemotaxis protein
MNLITEQMNEIEKSIVSKTTVLVIDSNSLTRSIISTSLKDCGFKSIEKVQNHIEAISLFQEKVFDVVICEWDEEEERSTLSLLSTIRGDYRFVDSVLIVVCQAVSTEGLIKAVENDIDAFLTKPFTPEKLIKTVLSSINNRLNPTTYKKKINEAKLLIEQKDFNKAQVILNEAMKEDAAPSQAAYYLGYICIRRVKIKEAREYFETGLKFKPYHIMCLFGMVFCCIKQKDSKAVYDTYKKILYLYPMHNQALEHILYAAISNYDLDSLIDIIKQLKYVVEIPAIVFDFVEINGAIIIGLMLNAKREGDLKNIYPIVKKILDDNIETRVKLLNLISRHMFADFVKTELEELIPLATKSNNQDLVSKLDIVAVRELYIKQLFEDTVLACRRYLNKYKPCEDIYELLIDSLDNLKMKDKAVDSYKEAVSQLKNSDYLAKRFKGLTVDNSN